MKLILSFMGCLAASMLSGCTFSAPSMMAGIGGNGTQEQVVRGAVTADAGEQMPASTGSIVPPQNEGEVVDLPDASAHMEAAAEARRGNADSLDTEELSAEERHRRELVNRGDLEEGQPLPAQ